MWTTKWLETSDIIERGSCMHVIILETEVHVLRRGVKIMHGSQELVMIISIVQTLAKANDRSGIRASPAGNVDLNFEDFQRKHDC